MVGGATLLMGGREEGEGRLDENSKCFIVLLVLSSTNSVQGSSQKGGDAVQWQEALIE